MIKLIFEAEINGKTFDMCLNLEEFTDEKARAERIRDLFSDAADKSIERINEQAPLA